MDVKKPIATVDLALSFIGLVKTGMIVLTMMLLEWAKLKERKAEVAAGAAKNDLEVEKLKSEIKGAGSAQEQIDSVLHANGLPPGKSSES